MKKLVYCSGNKLYISSNNKYDKDAYMKEYLTNKQDFNIGEYITYDSLTTKIGKYSIQQVIDKNSYISIVLSSSSEKYDIKCNVYDKDNKLIEKNKYIPVFHQVICLDVAATSKLDKFIIKEIHVLEIDTNFEEIEIMNENDFEYIRVKFREIKATKMIYSLLNNVKDITFLNNEINITHYENNNELQNIEKYLKNIFSYYFESTTFDIFYNDLDTISSIKVMKR